MILTGDSLKKLRTLPSESVQMCVTSPPYFGLRDYGVPGQIGLEPTPEEFTTRLVDVFREVRRVLKDDGVLWLNLGDSYNAHPGQRTVHDKAGTKQLSNRGSNEAASRSVPNLKPKDLCGIPWRVAFALQADGWYLRSDIIWHKPNPMPESVTDRPTKAHEYMFLLSKSAKYFYDADAVKEPALGRPMLTGGAYSPPGQTPHSNARPSVKKGGFTGKTGERAFRKVTEFRNRRTVWTVGTRAYKGAHFATFPPRLIEPCILAGSRPGDVVLDPFAGACTTGLVAQEHGRQFLGIELNPAYVKLGNARLKDAHLKFAA